MTEELKRDEFEKWLIDNKMAYGVRRDGDSYYSREIHNMWCSWKAGVRASRPEAESEMPAPETTSERLRLIAESGDKTLIDDVVVGRISIRDAAEKLVRRSAEAGNAARDDAGADT